MKRNRRPFAAEEDALFVKLYAEGKSILEIATITGDHPNAVYYRLKKAKVAFRPKKRYKRFTDGSTSSQRWEKRNPEKLAKKNRRYRRTDEGRAYSLLANAQARARREGVACTISLARICQALTNGYCEVSGLPFNMETGKGRASPWGPSIDRTQAGGDYTDSSVRIVVWMYNAAKNMYPASDVMILAKALVASEPS